MTDQQLEMLLIERCRKLDLSKTAFNNLEQLLKENEGDMDFLGGFEKNEIKALFEAFEYHIDKRNGSSSIKTRIGIYTQDMNQNEFDNLTPIGYYALDTDFNGVVLDDWFVIEKEKF